MVEKIKRHFLPVLVIFILSLTPFLWLTNNQVILGHDAGTPVSHSAHFLDRLQVWTYRYDSGADQSFALAGFFIHGFEYVLDQFGLSLSSQQKIEFATYFFLIGISMYTGALLLFKKLDKQFALLAAIIYQFNHFVLQAWFIAERTKFTAYIALPLYTVILYKVIHKELGIVLGSVLGALLISIFNAGGFIPLYGSLLLVTFSFVFTAILLEKKFLKTVLLVLQFGFLLSIFYLLLNLYWFLPYLVYLQNTFAIVVDQAGGFAGVLNWVLSISENTSFLNLLRWQGVQEWYVNTEHPYAFYYSSFFLVIASFIPLFIFLLALKRNQQRKEKKLLYLFLALLFSLLFMAGAHKPLGFIYIALLKYIPGFIAFRTPYYKFAPVFFFAAALIIAWFFNSFRFKKWVKTSLLIIFAGTYLCYHFPFFTVNFFQYTQDRTTQVVVPEHVQKYQTYIEKNGDQYNKILLYPGLNLMSHVSEYSWGYWSLAPLHSLTDRNQYVLPKYTNSLNDSLIKEMYLAILDEEDYWYEIAQNLGIDALLIEKDFSSHDYYGKDVMSKTAYLENDPRISMVEDFGQWKLYKLSEKTAYPVVHNYLQVNSANISDSFQKLVYENLGFKNPVAYSQVEVSSLNKLGEITLATCEDCLLQNEEFYLANNDIIFTPGSSLRFLYEMFNNLNEYEHPASRSLQVIFYLNKSFEKTEEFIYRKELWQRYIKELSDYHTYIDTSLLEQNIDNEELKSIQSNLLRQRKMLKDIVRLINRESEAQMYQASLDSIIKSLSIIEQKVRVSSDFANLVFSVELDEAGQYTFFLDNAIIPESQDNKVVEIKTKNSSIQQELNTESSFTEFATFEMEEGKNFIDVNYQPYKQELELNKEIIFNPDNYCTEISSGVLAQGNYTYSLSVTSNQNSFLSLHVLKDTEQAPNLPFWAKSEEMLQNIPTNLTTSFSVFEPRNIIIQLCAHTLQTELSVELIKSEIKRTTNVNMYVFKEENEPLIANDSYTIKRVSNTKTLFSGYSSLPGLVNTLHPTHKNWQNSSGLSATTINEGVGAYIVLAGEFSFSEEYSSQKLFAIGSVLSGFFAVLLLSYLLYKVRKQKSNES